MRIFPRIITALAFLALPYAAARSSSALPSPPQRISTATSSSVSRTAASTQAAATRVTVSGFVTDAGSGERMIDATVYERASFAGTTTNSYGFYSLPLPAGKAELIVSYLGYSPELS